MKPRLLIITNLYPTPWDLQRGTFNFQQFNHLAAHMDIRVITPISWRERLQYRHSDMATPVRHPLQGKVVYPWYWYTPGMLRGTYGLSLWASIRAQCTNWIRDFDPQLLLSSWAYPEGVAGTMLARHLGIPAFVKVHGSDINVIAQNPSVRRQIQDWGKQVVAVAAVSKDLGRKLQDMGIPRSKIRVTYNGIDHQRFRPLPPEQSEKKLDLPKSRRILFVGNLKKEKGCVDLLESFIQLSPQHPDLKLYFAGTGTMLPAMEKRCIEAQIVDKVQFLGKVAHADLNDWYNAADVVCLPSYNEGVPNVLLEAMACGTPVVASHVGGIPEIVTPDTGLLSQPGDIPGLQKTLDTALYKEWNHDKINKHSQQFSWTRNTRQMLDMFGCANPTEIKP